MSTREVLRRNASIYHIKLDLPRISTFCKKWLIKEFSLFGSVLREDFGPHSDIDVLVSFQAKAPWDLFDIVEMRDELAEILGRTVDLVERAALKNPFRKREILRTKKLIYASK